MFEIWCQNLVQPAYNFAIKIGHEGIENIVNTIEQKKIVKNLYGGW